MAPKYKCINCGYKGNELIYQLNDYSYGVATNDAEPEYIGSMPDWVMQKGLSDIKIGLPIGCPNCHAWGTHNFKEL